MSRSKTIAVICASRGNQGDFLELNDLNESIKIIARSITMKIKIVVMFCYE